MTFLTSIFAKLRDFFRRTPEYRLKGTTEENVLARQTTEVAELLRREWHEEKNGEITPADIARGSGRKAWWKCSVCGHEWQARVFSRYAGCGCPECAKVKAAWTRRLKKDKYQLQLFE